MNVENNPKAYLIGISGIVLLIVGFVWRRGIPHLINALHHTSLQIGIASVCLLLSIYGMAQYLGVIPSRHAAFPITGTFENPAGFAAMQAVMFPFAMALCMDKHNTAFLRIFALLSSLACALTVALSGSRTGLLAVCAAVVTVSFFQSRILSVFRTRWWLWLPVLAVVVLAGTLLYHSKPESADGRLFIWGRCLELISARPLSGHGIGGFQRCYMDAQAAYFGAHPESPYVMLADNVTHPFNEYLKLTVNCGLTGLAVALAALAMVVFKLLRADGRTKTVGLAVTASLFVMCQFSYPFHYAAVWFVAALAVLPAFFPEVPADGRRVSAIWRVTFIVILPLLLAGVLRMMYLDVKWAEVSGRALAGQIERMLPCYGQMKPAMKHNPMFLYNYAAELNYAGRYDESLAVAEECLERFNDYDVQMLLADSHVGAGRPAEAIAAYHLASRMIPCRFEPLDGLLELYAGSGDVENACSVANEILSKKIKVRSSRVMQIRHHAEAVLKQLNLPMQKM